MIVTTSEGGQLCLSFFFSQCVIRFPGPKEVVGVGSWNRPVVRVSVKVPFPLTPDYPNGSPQVPSTTFSSTKVH